MAKKTTIKNISSKPRTSHGHTYPPIVEDGQHAEIIAKTSIRLYGHVDQSTWTGTERKVEKVPYDRTFRIGDTVVYGSYNFVYTGKIVGIGPKTVTVEEDGGRKHRLSIYAFNWRNRMLDLDKVAARNFDTMMHI